MFEGLTYTDWLLFCVLYFQAFILLSLWWPRLSRLRFHGKPEQKDDVKGKDAYEKMFGKDGGEKKE